MTSRLILGDCIEVMREMPAASIDAVVTDPPYGIGFMGREWDVFNPDRIAKRAEGRKRKNTARSSETWPEKVGSVQGGGPSIQYDESLSGNQRFQAWMTLWAREVLRVLKPGGHLLSFGGTRTYHRLACAIEDAGFEVRDSIIWLYGSGFPKSLNIGNGKGTGLKPGHEPIVVARNPFRGTVRANDAEHGTAALNIDACRIELEDGGEYRGRKGEESAERNYRDKGSTTFTGKPGLREDPRGRWPANVILDEERAAELDEQSGDRKAGSSKSGIEPHAAAYSGNLYGAAAREGVAWDGYRDDGGASRFFYVAKTSRAERNLGLDSFEVRRAGSIAGGGGLNSTGEHAYSRNHHPTVKPVALMRHLVRLVAPAGAIVLDPFMGSGTTGIAAALEERDFIGIEREADYMAIAEARIKAWPKYAAGRTPAPKPKDRGPQSSLFGEEAS